MSILRILQTVFLLCLCNFSFAYSLHQGKIVDDENKPVNIDGVNWSGFQDSGFIDELYGSIPFYPLKKSNSSEIKFGLLDMLTHPWDDAGTGVDKTNGVSFKTIRLPMQPKVLNDNTPNNHFRLDLTDPTNKNQGNGVFCADWGQGACRTPLSVADSFYEVINQFNKNNVRVLIDFHQTPMGRNGNVVESNYSLAQYSADIKTIALKVKNYPNVIGIDVFNEPHNLAWFIPQGSQPAWTDVIAVAAKEIYENNPKLMLFVEGVGTFESTSICVAKGSVPQDPDAYQITPSDCGDKINFKTNWGENFQPLLDSQAALKGEAKLGPQFRQAVCKNLETPICDWLLGKESDPSHEGAHIVFSPHIYGKHVAEWQSSIEGSPHRFKWNFGFLIDAGFPVVIGETGYLSSMPDDIEFFEKSIAPYLKSKGVQNNLFYWTFNTNSGDTGGVRLDQNTINLDLGKEKNLYQLFNVL